MSLDLQVHPSLSSIGSDWIVVEAMSEADALRQAVQYDRGKHPMQRELRRAFRRCESLDSTADVIDIIYNGLYPLVAPGSVTLELEYTDRKRNWVAEIVGKDPDYGLRREFLSPKMDYTHANKRATRGVIAIYLLSPNKVYDISYPLSAKHTDRYFAAVRDKEIVRLERSEVESWVKYR